jgi:hypothetical protein
MIANPSSRLCWRPIVVAGLALLAASCNNVETPTTPTATGPYTDTFASQLGIRGSATRSFRVTDAGAVSVTLTSIGPPATVEVGLGLGIPNSGVRAAISRDRS